MSRIVFNESCNRCQYQECSALTYMFCEKCNVALCLKKDSNYLNNFYLWFNRYNYDNISFLEAFIYEFHVIFGLFLAFLAFSISSPLFKGGWSV